MGIGPGGPALVLRPRQRGGAREGVGRLCAQWPAVGLRGAGNRRRLQPPRHEQRRQAVDSSQPIGRDGGHAERHGGVRLRHGRRPVAESHRHHSAAECCGRRDDYGEHARILHRSGWRRLDVCGRKFQRCRRRRPGRGQLGVRQCLGERRCRHHGDRFRPKWPFRSAGLEVRARAEAAPTILRVDPAILVEGETAIISGWGFSTLPEENDVLVDGISAAVLSSSATRLSITVPRADCLPPREVRLRVFNAGGRHAVRVGLTPVRGGHLNWQQFEWRHTPAGEGCIHLPGSADGGEFLIGVTSVSEGSVTLDVRHVGRNSGRRLDGGRLQGSVDPGRGQRGRTSRAQLRRSGFPAGAARSVRR